MSSTEVINGVVAAIAALISVYVEGLKNVEKVKKNSCEQNSLTSVTRLEQVMKDSLQEIQNVVRISEHTFRRLYGDGDGMTEKHLM